MEKTSDQNETRQFTADMTVNAAMQLHPEAALVFAGYHLGGCSQCGINQIETIQQVCQSYGIPLDAMLSSLNDLLLQ